MKNSLRSFLKKYPNCGSEKYVNRFGIIVPTGVEVVLRDDFGGAVDLETLYAKWQHEWHREWLAERNVAIRNAEKKGLPIPGIL